jgi:UDP-N-acetyl-D-mannosaminuronic acid dehydrogenase
MKNSKIAVLGLAMKDYSNDDRISPPVDICNLLLERGAELRAFDPVVPTSYNFKVSTQEEALKDADAVMILAKQEGIDLEDMREIAKLTSSDSVIIDAKNVVDKCEAEKFGLRYWRI